MDVSLLRNQYRRERQDRHAQVVVLRTGEHSWFGYLQRVNSSLRTTNHVASGRKYETLEGEKVSFGGNVGFKPV